LGLSEQRIANICPISCVTLAFRAAIGRFAVPVVHRSCSVFASDGQAAVE
jgi:hypothetical protein